MKITHYIPILILGVNWSSLSNWQTKQFSKVHVWKSAIMIKQSTDKSPTDQFEGNQVAHQSIYRPIPNRFMCIFVTLILIKNPTELSTHRKSAVCGQS